MSKKIVVVIMGQDCEKFIAMCLESIKDADAIVYCDGGSRDRTKEIVLSYSDYSPEEQPFVKANFDKVRWIENNYVQDDKTMNGKQRNFYLDYIKKNYSDYWCLALDADEVVENLSKIKEFIQKADDKLWSIKMRHFIGNLGHEDSVSKTHYALNRLFKISKAKNYPLVEHPVLQSKIEQQPALTDCTTIWHLSHLAEMWNVKKKYENHIKKSDMHDPKFLKQWNMAHVFGKYPVSEVNLLEIPKIILKEFNVDWEELYFSNRELEVKHFIDAIHWRDYFDCSTAYEFGCGRGPRVYAMEQIGIDAYGLEISTYAFNNSYDINIQQGDILINDVGKSDLVIAYDLLEHIKYEDLEKAIDKLIKTSYKNILVSVPFKDTPNANADPTHIIKESKEWWIEKFTKKGLTLVPTPEHFLYKEQILIFKKNGS